MTTDFPLALSLLSRRVGVLEVNETVAEDVAVPVVGSASADVGVEEVVLSSQLEHRQSSLLLRLGVSGGRLDPGACDCLILDDETFALLSLNTETLEVSVGNTSAEGFEK